MASLRMNKPDDIRRTLQKVSELVVDGTIEPKQANCVIYACQTALTVIKTEELIKDNEEKRNSPFNHIFNEMFKEG